MAVDRNGTTIHVGDVVNVPATITDIQSPIGGNNVLVVVQVIGLAMSTDQGPTLNLGASQVVKQA